MKRQTWHVYAPLLPGITLVESHVFTGQNCDRYYVRTPFVQMIGLQGWQIITEKLRV